MDYYGILGINKNATKEEIKNAYRILAKKYHPDKNQNDIDKFKKINEAYKILSDLNKKKDYDSKNIKNMRTINKNVYVESDNIFGLNGIPSINDDFDNAMEELNKIFKNDPFLSNITSSNVFKNINGVKTFTSRNIIKNGNNNLSNINTKFINQQNKNENKKLNNGSKSVLDAYFEKNIGNC
jgi:curved DNA-binding protein